MTDSAIAEHIIYLVNEHKQELEQAIVLYNKRCEVTATLMAQDPENENIIFPLKPSPAEKAASTLLDRITATLENRNQHELTN